MSAIAGVAYPDGRTPDQATSARMTKALAHRAPNGTAVWCGEGAALTQLMAIVTPEDTFEIWPQVSVDGSLRLVADARLDNREELMAALRLPAHARGFPTDGELLLAAFRRWGRAAPLHLDGDFAFAAWNAPERTLFLARDAVGGKPLFYHVDASGTLYFASEIKALFAAAEIPRAPDELAVACHFGMPVTLDGTATFYAGVKALAPAHTLTMDHSGMRVERYWELDSERELRLSSDGEYAEAFREHFERAVRVRLRTAGCVGVTLSGGLDSSSIASVAAGLLPGRIHSFSAVFPQVPSADERHYQQSVVNRWELPYTEYPADAQSPLADHARIVRHIDGWQTAGNLRLNWNLYRLAARSGVSVMLEGFDGDTVVSHGMGYFGELAQQRRWLRLALEAGANARTRGMPVIPTVWSWWSSFGIYPFLRAYGLLGAWHRAEKMLARGTQRLVDPVPWKVYLRPEFTDRVRGTLNRAMVPTERAHHCRALMSSIDSHTTEVLNACGAAHGLDVRYPFFDRALIEFCVSLPPEQKIRRGVSRLILRRAMKGIVPDLVLGRTDKTNLEPAVAHTLRTFEADRIRQILLNGSLDEIADYVDIDACRQVFTRYEQAQDSPNDRLLVWLTLTFLLWLEESRAVR
jgi:asparagine synthase (glutamine-hydrolysing)